MRVLILCLVGAMVGSVADAQPSNSATASGNALAVGSPPVVEASALAKPSEPNAIEFRRWSIVEYFDGDHLGPLDLHYPDFNHHPMGPPKLMASPTITFARGHLEGSPSCGALSGDYRLVGQTLEIHAALLLGGFCSPNLTRQSDLVLAALGRVRRFDLKGEEMLLRGERGEVEVVLKLA